MSFASQRFHLVGVGGSGMSGLARMLLGSGADLSGSDAEGGEVVDSLTIQTDDIWVGCQPDRIRGQDGYVIRSAAVSARDPEVQECVRRGFTSLLYAEAVGRFEVPDADLPIQRFRRAYVMLAVAQCGGWPGNPLRDL